jgi:hypothetical protein
MRLCPYRQPAAPQCFISRRQSSVAVLACGDGAAALELRWEALRLTSQTPIICWPFQLHGRPAGWPTLKLVGTLQSRCQRGVIASVPDPVESRIGPPGVGRSEPISCAGCTWRLGGDFLEAEEMGKLL